MKRLTSEEKEQLIELLDRFLHDDRSNFDMRITIANLISALRVWK